MTSTKLEKLEVVAGIANRLEDDLRQLKEWIKIQFENEGFPSQIECNDMNSLDTTYSSYSGSSIEDSGNHIDQHHPNHPSTSYNFSLESIEITQPKSEIEFEGDQEPENEFILGDNYQPEDEDPLDKGPNEMMVEFQPQIKKPVQGSRLGRRLRNYECNICHSQHKNGNALRSHKYSKHGSGAKKKDLVASSTTPIASKSNDPVMMSKKKVKRSYTTSNKYECFICGKNFNDECSGSNSMNHFNHLQNLHFVCGYTLCHLQFPSYEALMEHKNTPLQHSNLNPT